MSKTRASWSFVPCAAGAQGGIHIGAPRRTVSAAGSRLRLATPTSRLCAGCSPAGAREELGLERAAKTRPPERCGVQLAADPTSSRPGSTTGRVPDDEIGKARGYRSPPLSWRQSNGWANFVVGVTLSVGAVSRLTPRTTRGLVARTQGAARSQVVAVSPGRREIGSLRTMLPRKLEGGVESTVLPVRAARRGEGSLLHLRNVPRAARRSEYHPWSRPLARIPPAGRKD
jgi:hypothetical protein